MTKIRQEVIELGTAIKRCSPLIAENLAIFSPSLSAKELEYLRSEIGRSYIMRLMFPGYTVGHYLRNYDHMGQIANDPTST